MACFTFRYNKANNKQRKTYTLIWKRTWRSWPAQTLKPRVKQFFAELGGYSLTCCWSHSICTLSQVSIHNCILLSQGKQMALLQIDRLTLWYSNKADSVDRLMLGWLFPGPPAPLELAIGVGLLLSLCIDQVEDCRFEMINKVLDFRELKLQWLLTWRCQ